MEKRIESYCDQDHEFRQTNDLIQAIQNAKEEWECARSCFDYVHDELLIDYAIFKERATRAKYTYLLRIAKERNIKVKLTFK
ncbi:hypothetical protein SH2C18_49590 [Clostridium sediminicola]|uniref:YaaL family protein n=1 Tax=Clostridium sediminicola TaxID=3114879 RepID=UPI0031F20200